MINNGDHPGRFSFIRNKTIFKDFLTGYTVAIVSHKDQEINKMIVDLQELPGQKRHTH